MLAVTARAEADHVAIPHIHTEDPIHGLGPAWLSAGAIGRRRGMTVPVAAAARSCRVAAAILEKAGLSITRARHATARAQGLHECIGGIQI